MKYVIVLVVSLLSVGCEMLSKGSLTAPESAAPESAAPESVSEAVATRELVKALAGESTRRWTGLQGPEAGCAPSQCGEGGAVQSVFSKLSESEVEARVEYIALSGVTYRATASGTLARIILIIDAVQNPQDTLCGYRATGKLTKAINGQDRIEGDFIGFSRDPLKPLPCGNKKGWFWMNAEELPPPPPKVCEEVKPLVFPARQVMINWPLPQGGDKREDEFAVPAGTWFIHSVTGDNHSEKPGEAPQTHEQVWYLFKDALGVIASTPPTDDVPEDVDVKATSLGDVILSRPATHVETRHAGPTILEGGIQTDSVYPVLLTAACPVP